MQFDKRLFCWRFILPLCISGCSTPEAIRLLSVQPDPAQCRFVAQAVGSGGGIVSGDFSDTQELREDAEENIKEIARLRGGNVVQIVETQRNKLSVDSDTAEIILIGRVYRCR
jgi:hypothetical protein